ncbi:MAG: hypothetical protein E7G24_10295, partial [Clostridium celatum]|nr:hypothetical protein [Clostridium celatum]
MDKKKLSQEEWLEVYIKSAYKKLKSYSYYEKRNIYLKERIVEFESENEFNITNMDNYFKKLAREIIEISKVSSKNRDYKNSFPVDAKLRVLPKNLIDREIKEEGIITNKVMGENSYIDKIIHFYDLDIKTQIIGVVWILLIGKELEKEYKEFAAGNILDDSMYLNNLKLFKPYYTMYESWRDDGISIVEEQMKNNKRTIMLSLDIKEYFYSINLKDKKYENEILEKYNYIIEKKYGKFKCENYLKPFEVINDIVFNVIKGYSNTISSKIHEVKFNNKEDKNLKFRLPIGFLPSNILGNWYLKNFDEELTNKLNPLYYKRYVDDILIIFNAEYIKENEDNIHKYIFNNKFCKNEIFKKSIYFVNNKNQCNEIVPLEDKEALEECIKKIKRINVQDKIKILKNIYVTYKKNISKEELNEEFERFLQEDKTQNLIYSSWDEKNILEKLIKLVNDKNNVDNEENIKELIDKINIDGNEIKTIYLLNNYISESAYLVIQDSKVKIYDFKKEGSNSLIRSFKEELRKNASVFKFLPERYEIIRNFDNEVYKIDYKDTIHKISSVNDINVNPYDLSKFLARIIYSDKLEDSYSTKDVDEKILGIFESRAAIKYYFLWDKVFNYYMLNKKYSYIFKIFRAINKNIDEIDIQIDNTLINKFYYREEKMINLRNDLKTYLKIVIALNYSLDDGLFISKFKEKKDEDYYNKIIEKGLNTTNDLSRYDKLLFKYEKIYSLKENIRKSNMLNHSLVRSSLINYCYNNYLEYIKSSNVLVYVDFLHEANEKIEIHSDLKSCKFSNIEYKKSFDYFIDYFYNTESNECSNDNVYVLNSKCEISCLNKDKVVGCKKEIHEFAKVYNPRVVHFHECILYEINKLIGQGKIVSRCEEIIGSKKIYNSLNRLDDTEKYELENEENTINKYLNFNDSNDEYTIVPNINKNIKELVKENKEKRENIKKLDYLRYFNREEYLFTQQERVINILSINKYEKKDKLKIAVINMKIYDKDLENSFKKISQNTEKKLEKIYSLLNQAVKEEAEMIIFPEASIPFKLLEVLSNFSRKHNVVIICGLEHIVYDNKLCCNYMATIIPYKTCLSKKYNNYYANSIIKLRLKNHYSPKEKDWVLGYGWKLPEQGKDYEKEYDLIRWKGIDFSSFSCFELANIKDRALFTSYVDLLVGSVHNRDINYYSNIMESLVRDVHCYCAQVNDSTLGDSRIIKPSSTYEKNILQI